MSPANTVAEDVGISRWWVLVLLGVLSIGVGILCLTHPKDTLLFLGILFGVTLLFWGSSSLVTAFERGTPAGISVLHVLVGFLGLLAGLFCLVHPGESVIALLISVSFWFILTGAADIVQGISQREHRGLLIVLGLLSITAGVIIVSDPDIGLRTLALLAGLGFLVRGTLAVALGFAVKNA